MKTFLNKITNIDIRKGLFYSIVDAILWAMMFGFADQYLVPYAVAIGANAFQVSLISAAGQISICIAQILGANFIYKYRKRKKVSIITNQIHAISWLFIFYISYITKNVYFVIFFYFIGIFATNFAGPGWLSWMNDLVPPHLRGEFWGKRNKIIGIFQFLSIIFAGFFLNYFKRMSNQFLGFGILFTFAFLFRYLSIIPLKKQYEPPMQYISSKKLEELNFFEFIKSIPLLIKTNFGKFALFSFLMTFSTNFMAPILPVFILKSLKFNYIQYMVVTLTATVASFLSMTYWGPLADRYGNYRILYITCIWIPTIAFAWIFFKNIYILIFLQLFAGFVWAGFGLATGNYIFDAVRRENIPIVWAYFNTFNNLFAFGGSILGGLTTKILPEKRVEFLRFAEHNYEIIFAVSAILRLVVVLLFAKRFKEVRNVEKSPNINFFYVYKPASNVINMFTIIVEKMKRIIK